MNIIKRIIQTGSIPILIFLLISTTSAQSDNKGDAIMGKWITEEGKSIVEVYKKEDSKYYAKILWLKEPNDEDGNIKKDKNNPDEKLRSRLTVGMEFMLGFEYDSDDEEWENGKLYDPESGNTYSGYMELQSETILKLRGYVGISLLGRTSYWKRAPEKD